MDMIDVTAYGMKPVSDPTNNPAANVTAFNAALAAGDFLYFPPGTYKIASPLVVNRSAVCLIANDCGIYEDGGRTFLQGVSTFTGDALIKFGDAGGATINACGMSGSWYLWSALAPADGLRVENAAGWKNSGVVTCQSLGKVGAVFDGVRQSDFGTIVAHHNLKGGIELRGESRSCQNNTCRWFEANKNGGHQLGLIAGAAPNDRVGQISIRGLFETFDVASPKDPVTCVVLVEACTDVVFENVNINGQPDKPLVRLGKSGFIPGQPNRTIDGVTFSNGQFGGGSAAMEADSDTVKFMRIAGAQYLPSAGAAAFLDATSLSTAHAKIVIRDCNNISAADVIDPNGVVIATYVQRRARRPRGTARRHAVRPSGRRETPSSHAGPAVRAAVRGGDRACVCGRMIAAQDCRPGG